MLQFKNKKKEVIIITDNELLFAISDIFDKKLNSALQPLQDDITNIKLKIENTIEPQIKLLAENYIPAAKRYEKQSAKIEAMQADIDIMKKVITEHSEKLHKIS